MITTYMRKRCRALILLLPCSIHQILYFLSWQLHFFDPSKEFFKSFFLNEVSNKSRITNLHGLNYKMTFTTVQPWLGGFKIHSMSSSENQAAAPSQVCHSCSSMQCWHSHHLEFRLTSNLSTAHTLQENSCRSCHLFTGITGGVFSRLLFKECSTTCIFCIISRSPQGISAVHQKWTYCTDLPIRFRKQAWQQCS